MSPIDADATCLDLIVELERSGDPGHRHLSGGAQPYAHGLAALRGGRATCAGSSSPSRPKASGLAETVEGLRTIRRGETSRSIALPRLSGDPRSRWRQAPLPLDPDLRARSHARTRLTSATIRWYEQGLPHVWLPYCQMKVAPPPLPVVRTRGCRIILADGRELIDGIASWWSVCHGYNHPHIREACQRQLATMPHVMFGGLAHEPAFDAGHAAHGDGPAGADPRLLRGFGVDRRRGRAQDRAAILAQQRPAREGRFLCFADGYHGDTFGAMAVSDPERSMHKAFRQCLGPASSSSMSRPTQMRSAQLDEFLGRHWRTRWRR